LKRELIISYSAHAIIIIIAFLITAFSRPMKLPDKVYSVQIVAAPQPEPKKVEEKKPEPEPEPEEIPEPEPKPQIETKPEPKPNPKPQPKPEPKPAEVPKPKQTSPQGTGHITVDGQNFKDDYYLNLIYMKVYRNWLPPVSGREMTATIYFKILRSGDVKDAKVEKRSGASTFDERALRTILVSAPFPELPETYTGDHLGVHFEFIHNP